MKGSRYSIEGAKGFQATVFEDEETNEKNIAISYGIHKDNLPDLKGDYYNFKFYMNQLKNVVNGAEEIIELEGIKGKTGTVRKVGSF